MKKLIIVCEEKYRKYGDYLSQLISLEDDAEDNIVGTKDGEVAAQVWLEKDYQANSAQLSSSQYILFVGSSKLIKEKSTHMKIMFSKFGMTYGWLGKQAVLTVGEAVSNNEYDQFIEYALSYKSDLERLMEKRDEKIITEDKKLLEEVKEEPVKEIKQVGLAVFNAIGAAIADVSEAGVNVVKQVALSNKIKEQQYSCAIMKFYLSSLAEFLGM